MPTYEYECKKCKHHFTKFQSMNDAPIKKCPKCGGKTERLISAGAGLIFKGKGFYQTDYKNISSGNKASGKDKKNVSSKPTDCKNTGCNACCNDE